MSMDLYLLDLFNRTLAHPLLDPLMVALTTLGLVFLSTAAAGFAARGDRRAALAIVFALAAAGLATLVFYRLGMRPRPPLQLDVRLILPAPPLPSFPSGHAALAFAVATVVAMRLRSWRWGAALLCGALAIGLSRIYLGHHYPTDVLGGAILGLSIGAACFGLFCTYEPLNERVAWLLWPQIGVVVLVTLMTYLGHLPWHWLAWPNADKVLHFLLFGTIAFWLNLWLKGRSWHLHSRFMLPLAVLLPLGVAFAEEMLQALSPIRTASFLDLAADLSGLVLFWGLSMLLLRESVQNWFERSLDRTGLTRRSR